MNTTREMNSKLGKMASLSCATTGFTIALILFCLFEKSKDLYMLFYSGMALGVVLIFSFVYLAFSAYGASAKKNIA